MIARLFLAALLAIVTAVPSALAERIATETDSGLTGGHFSFGSKGT